MQKPCIFISSTILDLEEIRVGLSEFITSIGCIPVLSELDTFPIDPNEDAISSCLKAVEEKTDIFVLIVGTRYGSIAREGRSVTHLEYLRARSLGKPIFCFIRKDILSSWENPGKTLQNGGQPDNSKLFDFISQIRTEQGTWTFPFEEAVGLQSTLKTQLAYLFQGALEDRRRLRTQLEVPENISATALRLLLEEPRAWEQRFFLQTYEDALKGFRHPRLDHSYKLEEGSLRFLDSPQELLSMVRVKMAELATLVDSIRTLIDRAFVDAMAPPGVPADPVKLAYVAQRLAKYFGSFLSWSADARALRGPDGFEKLLSIFATFPNQILDDLEEFLPRAKALLTEALAHPAADGPQYVEWNLTFALPSSDDFNDEMERLTDLFAE